MTCINIGRFVMILVSWKSWDRQLTNLEISTSRSNTTPKRMEGLSRHNPRAFQRHQTRQNPSNIRSVRVHAARLDISSKYAGGQPSLGFSGCMIVLGNSATLKFYRKSEAEENYCCVLNISRLDFFTTIGKKSKTVHDRIWRHGFSLTPKSVGFWPSMIHAESIFE